MIKFHSHSNRAVEQTFSEHKNSQAQSQERRGNDGSQKTGERQSFHSYTKPGPGVQVPTYADNFSTS